MIHFVRLVRWTESNALADESTAIESTGKIDNPLAGSQKWSLLTSLDFRRNEQLLPHQCQARAGDGAEGATAARFHIFPTKVLNSVMTSR